MTRHSLATGMLCGAVLCAPLCGCAVPFRHHGPSAPALAARAKPAAKKARTRPAPRALVAADTETALADGAADWFRRARKAFAADSADAGEAALRRSLERDSCFAPALALLSHRDFAAGRHAEAVERLGVVSRDPERFSPEQRAALLAGLALHLDALGDNASARATLAAVPDDDLPAAVRVSVLLRGDTPEEAAAPALEALKHDRRSAVNLNNTGIVQLRAGDADTACRMFQMAIERDASLPGPYYNLAILEKFYRFDDAAALKWYQAYRLRSAADPDGLADVFRDAPGKPVADGGAAR